jgi:hypothetical protein
MATPKRVTGLVTTPWGVLRTFAVIHLHCPYCNADPGHRCKRVKSGKAYYEYVHDDRVKPVLNIFYIGRGVGRRQVWNKVAAFADDGIVTGNRRF